MICFYEKWFLLYFGGINEEVPPYICRGLIYLLS